MTNKEKTADYLKFLTQKVDAIGHKGFTAQELADKLGIQRNVVSHWLNELSEEGRAIKINTRPVYFLDKQAFEAQPEKFIQYTVNHGKEMMKEDPFVQLIGYNGSIKSAVARCRSAVTYPPSGLPLLLIGSTGVGKSFIAQLIHEYACSMEVISQKAPFVIFNCAEYANNPELLAANLFGYVKGAFTGAASDKIGLVEDAEGGYLFLDEIHRLPPEGQEKLFLLLDKGIYRRLGETGKWRKANVRLVFATTEDPEECLIKTFLRRIPLVVQIPSLDERPLPERLQLIYEFYRQEARVLDRDIFVGKQVINAFLKTTFSGNIGKIINVIKYSCAHAYNRNIHIDSNMLRIHLHDLSEVLPSREIGMRQQELVINGMIITRDGKPEEFRREEELDKLTNKVALVLQEYLDNKVSFRKMESRVFRYLNSFVDTVVFAENHSRNQSLIMETLQSIADTVLTSMESSYGIKYYGNSALVIGRFVNYFIEQRSEWDNPAQQDIEQTIVILERLYSKEMMLARKMRKLMEAHLDDELSNSALIYFCLYIKSISKEDSTLVTAIIIAHGYSTASSIASVANRFLGQYIFEFFDMPMELSMFDMMSKIETYLKTVDTTKGVVILVDMGSLEEIYKGLITVVKGDIGIINNISTQLALDVGSRLLKHQNIEHIVSEATNTNSSRYKFIKSVDKKKAILTTCITGIGTAVKIKELLIESVGRQDIEVIAYDYNRLKGNGRQDEVFSSFDIRLIIGTADPGISDIPYLSLAELIAGRGEEELGAVLKESALNTTVDEVNNAVVKMFSLQNVLHYITILNPDKIIDQLEKWLSTMEVVLGIKFDNALKVSLYVHTSCLVERLIMQEALLNYPCLEKWEQCHAQFIEKFRETFSVIEQMYRVQVPTSEIGFIYDIIKNKIKAFSY